MPACKSLEAEAEKSCGKCVRGLVCNRCNRVIGNAQDDVGLLKSAVAYLEQWQEKVK
jgi:hypothetical protein